MHVHARPPCNLGDSTSPLCTATDMDLHIVKKLHYVVHVHDIHTVNLCT